MISKEELDYIKKAVEIALQKGTQLAEGDLSVVSKGEVLKAMDDAYEALVPPAYRVLKGGGGDAR